MTQNKLETLMALFDELRVLDNAKAEVAAKIAKLVDGNGDRAAKKPANVSQTVLRVLSENPGGLTKAQLKGVIGEAGEGALTAALKHHHAKGAIGRDEQKGTWFLKQQAIPHGAQA